jgi:putative SOS response-associated peptidase YedK
MEVNMCGRYYLKADQAAISARFSVTTIEERHVEDLNLVPSQMMQVILNVSPQTITYAQWGFIPSWIKDPDGGNKPINAVGETVAVNGYFRASFQSRRCLVIASGFYEWERVDGKPKQPYRISLETSELFAMAGIWDIWQSPNGEALTFAIVTVPANEVVGRIHNRMPVFLLPEEEKVWLDTSAPDTSAAQALLRPFPADLMIAELMPSEFFKAARPKKAEELSLFDEELVLADIDT